MREPRTVIPRLLAGGSGLLLAVFAGASWWLAQLLRGLEDNGHALVSGVSASASRLAEESTEGTETEAMLFAASGAERLAHDVLGDAGSTVQRFQLLMLLSLVAAAFAIAVAVRRLPLARWPEWAWAAAAALALLPAMMLQLWLIVAIPAAAGFALAATLHLTRRHDLTLAAARRHAAPQVQAVRERGAAELPAMRERAETLGRTGQALARKSVPLARGRFRRGGDER
jgi:hypothetical protein